MNVYHLCSCMIGVSQDNGDDGSHDIDSHYHTSFAGKYDVSLARACAPQCRFTVNNLSFSYKYKSI